MNHSSQAGPSRPRQATPDLLGSSPEFGDFTSAPSCVSSAQQHTPQPLRSNQPRQTTQFVDLLSDEPLPEHPWPPDTAQPLHIELPPRPSEITPDYEPPVRSPRRLSQLSFPGPSSPPQLSDIVFHPTQSSEQLSHSKTASTAHSKLFNTLATTTKIASRWKTALDHHTFSTHTGAAPAPSETALPIDVDHSTPFNLRTLSDDVYVPPSGAPGFKPQSVTQRPTEGNNENSGTVLCGRSASTAPVLTSNIADALRQHLPARQRLSSQWTLLFSLDQHGASLATLYRLVESYALKNKSAGNILIIRDGTDSVFGVFLNESVTRKEGQYYGGGDCFLFKVRGDFPVVFRWTGKNQYFALCESNLLSFGGGGGTYGIVLDAAFNRNSSATCPTFDNEVLCSSQTLYSATARPFECVGLEIWGTR